MLIKKEYRLRLIAVSLWLLFAVLVLASILLFPTYVFTVYRTRVSKQEGIVGPSDTDKSERAQLVSKIHDANQNMLALQPNVLSSTPTQVISLIMKDKTPDNFINSLIYTSADGSSFTLTVRGVAKTRESLLAFANALRAEPGITAVNLPISNFTGDTSIDFSFDVTGSTQK